ncbi:hypothetical protein [Nitrosospira multiformis]|uniref:Uncharacterized protein n=1 Tax=Nitrosospira multiformis TaxID=1231 RepID=A0A1I7IXZ3_9PROT|nr:hypothetical protein [Nitrosospira multiformis]SFU77742.1 hypothetical protein SAMN05216417_13114 [Nitrosospira multiformis]
MNHIAYLEELLPASPERDEVLSVVRLGLSFQQQQRIGKRPGFLKGYLLKLLPTIEGAVTFDRLLAELELEAARREMYGTEASPIEKVDRVWQIVTYHHPKTGRQQLTFKSIMNKLSWCKSNLQ